MNKIIITILCILSTAPMYAWSGRVTNKSSVPVRAIISYHGETPFTCRPDVRTLNPEDMQPVDTVLCCIKKVVVEAEGRQDVAEQSLVGACGHFAIDIHDGPKINLMVGT